MAKERANQSKTTLSQLKNRMDYCAQQIKINTAENRDLDSRIQETRDRSRAAELELRQKKAEIEEKEDELQTVSSGAMELASQIHSDRSVIEMLNTYLSSYEANQTEQKTEPLGTQDDID